MKQKRRKAAKSSTLVPTGLLPELRELIQSARQMVARAVNTGLTLLYWRVGERIRKDVLANRRAEYGKEILVTLSQEMVAEFGSGVILM
jgi:hypothetical protein